jgi:hypothetical protein
MVASFALGGNLPPGDANGAVAIASQMIAAPDRLRVLLVMVDCPTTKVDNLAGGGQTAVARIRRIEPVLPRDLSAAEQFMRRSLEWRGGVTVLTLDLEDEITAAFSAVDLDDPDGGAAE